MQRRYVALPAGTLAWVAVAALFWLLLYNLIVHRLLDVHANLVGHLNGIAIIALLLWVLADVILPRRAIFGWLGLIDPPKRSNLQFLRLTTIMALTLFGLLAALRVPLDGTSEGKLAYWSLVGVVASAAVGALGWSLSNLQQQTLKRVTDTEQAIRDILQDYENRIIKRAATHIYRDVTGRQVGSEEVPCERVTGNFLETVNRIATFRNAPGDLAESIYFDVPSQYFVYEYLNILERISLGVRLGHYEFNYTYNALHEIVLNAYGRWRQFVMRERDGKVYKILRARGVRGSMTNEKMVYENFTWLVWHFSWLKNSADFNRKFLNEAVVSTDGMLPLPYVPDGRRVDGIKT